MAAPAKLAIDIVVNNKNASKALKDTGDDVEGLETQTAKSTSGMGAALAGFAGGAAFAAVQKGFQLIGDSIKLASDQAETTSQVGQIFGDAAGKIEAFAAGSAKTMGLSKTAAMNAANTFATFGKGAGLAGDELASFSTDMVGLSSDLASFKNTTPEEAIDAIGAALRGESEPIRKYGVMLDDATLKNRALAMGLIQNTKEALTPQQKALAAQAEILAQTSDAQGDFARTSEGMANQQRIAAAQWEDMQATIGSALLPVLTELGGFLTGTLIPALQTVAGFVADNAAVFIPLAAAIGTIVIASKAWAMAQAALNAVLAINPVILIVAAIAALVAALVWAYQNVQWFHDAVDTAISAVGAAFTWLWENAIQPAIKAIAAAASWLWDNVLRPVIGFIIDNLKTWGTVIGWLWDNAIRPVLGFIATAFTWLWENALRPVIGFIADRVRELGSVFSWLWGNAIQPAFSAITDGATKVWGWIRDTFNELVGFITGLPARIGSAAKGMWDGIWEAFKGVINLIIRGWNSLAFAIPGFDLGPVHFDGFRLALPQIPYLATGGYVSRPTLAVVGEAGPEIVSPVRVLRSLLAEGAGTGGTTVVNQFTVNVTHSGLGVDSPTLQRDVVGALQRWSARNGPIPVPTGS